jgi:site-specific DNA recombinase
MFTCAIGYDVGMDTACKAAREYLRVSQDRSGRLQSPAEQHQDNEQAAASNGWELGVPYQEDGGISASRFTSKRRPGFGQLADDLAGGRFGAEILILWESSRGSRRVGEWATLVDKLEDARVKVHVTSHGRTYDPANARDRRSLMEDAVDSEYESGKSSARIRRAAAAHAAAGLPHGRVPYGYRREYKVSASGKRELTGQVPEPAEAAVVAELFARLRNGHSLRAIAKDFGQRGIRTRPNRAHPQGVPFSPSHLRDMALRPLYGGVRIHEPGNRSGRYRGNLDGAVTATWPPLTDAETFHGVRAMLQAPERRTSRPGRAVHLLSLIAACDVCGGPLTARDPLRERRYVCRDKSCVRINADELDGYAESVMLAYLARDDVLGELRATPERGGELDRVRADLAEARSELASLQAAGAARTVTVATVLAMEPALAAAAGRLEARERQLQTPAALSVIPPGKDAARRWNAAPMSARRQAARLLCSPAILGQLRVGRVPAPGHKAEPAQRVTWDRA